MRILAQLKREFTSIFFSPIAYVLLTATMIYNGLVFLLIVDFLSNPRSPHGAAMQFMFGGTNFYYILIIAAASFITMRLISQEKSSGTLETLLTAPINEIQVVIAKYLAALGFYLVLWLPTLAYPAVLSRYSEVDWGPIASGYLGTLGMGMMFLSFGLLASALTRSQIVAALISFGGNMVLFLLGVFEFISPAQSSDSAISYLNLWNHMESFGRGIVDTRHLVYYGSVTLFALFCCVQVLSGQEVAMMTENTSGSRRLRAGSNTVISIVGAAVILVALNYLGMRHYVRGDWTSAGIYTLSDKSEKMLETLGKEVQLYVLWSQGDPRFPDVKELIERYVGVSSKIKMEILDQDLNPERVQWVIDRYGAKMRDMGDGTLAVEASIIVVSGDNIKFVSSSEFEDLQGDMFAQEAGGHEDELSGYKAEQAISSAILSVTSDTQQLVCFTQGHDEWPFEGFGGQGLGSIRAGLGQDGYKVEAIATASGSSIPSECNLVVVAGPKKAFLEDESAKLGGYLGKGGRVLLLLDPIIEGDGFNVTGLEQLTANHGIKLSRDIVFENDPRRLVSPSPFTFTASEFSTHDAVKQLTLPDAVGAEIKEQIGVYPVVFTMARSLVVKDSEGVITEVLARSSESSWGEVDLASMDAGQKLPEKDQYDTSGPTVIAAAAIMGGAGNETEAGRLAVVGDSDFLSEEFFMHSGLNNRDFWSGLVGWLTARADLISIAPKNPEHVRLNMTVDDVWTVRKVVIFEILFFVVLGVVVWVRRRS